MSTELFGTDGIRGQAGKYPLDEPTVKKIGTAIGMTFGKAGRSIVVGHDPRESSPWLAEAVVTGLTQAGCDVKAVGVITTPGLAYLTRQTKAAAGVMVTASHNPYTDNGIKVFTAHAEKLTDKQQGELNKAIYKDHKGSKTGQVKSAEELVERYVSFLVDSAKRQKLSGLKLAIDTANGAASGIAEKVFKKLGANVTMMFNQPDGRNINEGCGATHLEALKKKVLQAKLDVGLALDGDADRLMLVDSQGREVNGDHILYILAVSGNHRGAVSTVMSNYGFEKSLKDRDIELVRTLIGDRYVMQTLKKTGFKIGGEQSGHIVMPVLLPTGDGLLAAVQALTTVAKSRKSLDTWRDEVKLLPQALINIKYSGNKPPAQLLKQFSIDQTKLLKGHGRILIRASGTEPLIRIMVEGEAADEIAKVIVEKMKQRLMKASA